MSTMYDALRKAEAERRKAASHGDERTSGGSPLVGSDSKRDNAEVIKIVVLLVAVAVVFTIAFYRFNATKATMAKKPTTKQNAVSAAAATTPVTALNPVKAPRAPGTYGLDGVIDAGEQSIAIINGRLIRIDQSIDHLMLMKISPKEVELLNTKDNTIVILKI